MVLDITQSMNVEDAGEPPAPRTRLEHAKQGAVRALGALPCGSEVGLGLFTGHRTLLLLTPVEICEHYSDLVTTVRAVDWRMAWAARSEVAKGLHSALALAGTIGRRTAVVFLTDGHEAPPLHPEHRPRFSGVPGQVRGVVVGVGGAHPVPIPKLDTDGRARGFFGPDEVMQVDAFTLGRSASVSDEPLAGVDRTDLDARILAGREHLSSLREGYLIELADGLGLRYGRMGRSEDLGELLLAPELAIERWIESDLRPPLACLALLMILLTHVRAPPAGGRLGARGIGPSRRSRVRTR